MSDSPESSNPPIGRKPGRPVDPYLAIYRALFPEWSARTVARYALCMRRLRCMGIAGDEWAAVCAKATRPNGSINVLALNALTHDKAAMWTGRQYPEARQ